MYDFPAIYVEYRTRELATEAARSVRRSRILAALRNAKKQERKQPLDV